MDVSVDKIAGMAAFYQLVETFKPAMGYGVKVIDVPRRRVCYKNIDAFVMQQRKAQTMNAPAHLPFAEHILAIAIPMRASKP